MKINQVLGIGVRIAGIFLLVTTIRDLPQWIIGLKQAATDPIFGESDLTYYYYFMVFTAFTIFAALAMIKFPATIANSLARTPESDKEITSIDIDAIYYGGLFLIAVYILTWAIPDLVYNALFFLQIHDTYPQELGTFNRHSINLITTVVEIAIAIYLLFGAHNIVRFIRKLRG